MPLPPFHLGPGAATKALAGRRFSFSVFALSQVLMDLEPLVRIYAGSAVLHGFTNTLAGAALVALVAVVPGRVLCGRLLRAWNGLLERRGQGQYAVAARVGRSAAVAGAVTGVGTHLLLDAVMHPDARPLAPLAEANPFFDLLSLPALEVLCLGLGVLGVAALAGQWFRRRGPARSAD